MDINEKLDNLKYIYHKERENNIEYHLKVKDLCQDIKSLNWVIRDDLSSFTKGIQLDEWNYWVRSYFLIDDERKELFFKKMLGINNRDYILSRAGFCITPNNLNVIEKLFDKEFHKPGLNKILDQEYINLNRIHKVIDECILDKEVYYDIGIILNNPNIDRLAIQKIIEYVSSRIDKDWRIGFKHIVNHKLVNFNLIWLAVNSFKDINLNRSELRRLIKLSNVMSEKEKYLLSRKIPKLLQKGLKINLLDMSINELG